MKGNDGGKRQRGYHGKLKRGRGTINDPVVLPRGRLLF
ncbi:hypothetical protein C8R28_103530 [Nitrosomonas ureae]|uniref:Uncharacterized protein n=1 Tax=Nitrosomonas ureae TaxID=44577 RepID=A0A2T5IAR3_9PROT|nr:hypothetical protein C8R28_103530 [Nitrosomonas ureae]